MGGRSDWSGFFPKVLETLQHDREVFDASEVWLEAGDWYVWQLVGGDASVLPRSTCQAGYKAMWSKEDGYPSDEFLTACHRGMKGFVANKMPGRLVSPGEMAGELDAKMAKRMGLKPGDAS